MPSCVFCSIVAGESPAWKVYENDAALAFLDIHPAADGHTLVVPKTHAAGLWDIEERAAERTMAAAVRVAAILRTALEPDGINIVHASGAAAFQDVFHFHLHLIPRRLGDATGPLWPLDQHLGDPARLDEIYRVISAAAQ